MTHTKSPTKPPPTRLQVNLIEEAAFCRAIGGKFRGAELEGPRVQIKFELSEKQLERLKLFRHGQGGRIDANQFAEAMAWAKTAIFSCRRSSGVERR